MKGPTQKARPASKEIYKPNPTAQEASAQLRSLGPTEVILYPSSRFEYKPSTEHTSRGGPEPLPVYAAVQSCSCHQSVLYRWYERTVCGRTGWVRTYRLRHVAVQFADLELGDAAAGQTGAEQGAVIVHHVVSVHKHYDLGLVPGLERRSDWVSRRHRNGRNAVSLPPISAGRGRHSGSDGEGCEVVLGSAAADTG